MATAMRTTALSVATALLVAALASSEPLPYNPTRVLLSPNSTHAYVLGPNPDVATQAQLRLLDFTSTISSGSPNSFNTIFSTLPFLSADQSLAYTPVIDSAGNITVAVGDCSQGVQGASVWRWAGSDYEDPSSWTQYNVSLDSSASSSSSQDVALAGINYLSAGLSFSERVNGDSSLYIFGGMCPTSTSTTEETWTHQADYSDQMLTLMPQPGDLGVKADYSVEMVASRGPPIAEAGFSITALTPTYSEQTKDGDARTQQQSFVLLGGHTQQAFINMSQVALFSLPQESWSFLPVGQPEVAVAKRGVGPLGKRQSASNVEPRSGHTAVLTEDGSKIVVFGGWVGDVSTPAEPQLAVLNVGSGFGGDESEWSWSVPTVDGSSGLGEDTGLYGHGAAMLPGNVMMVTGGYSIEATDAKLKKRAANDQVLLFNVTANTWVTTYTPPESYLNAMSEKQNSSGPLSSTSDKAGLAVGLVVGMLLLAGLVIFYFWYSRRLRRAREDRENEVATSHERPMSQISQPFLQRPTSSDRPGLGRFWTSPQPQPAQAYPWDPTGGQSYHNRGREADATGLLLDIPSPTRGLRKGVAGKQYNYHAAPRYDEKRTTRGSGSIHPIAEQDDEDEQGNRAHAVDGEHITLSEAQRQLRAVEDIFAPSKQLRDIEKALEARPVRPISDPFRDPDPPQPNPLGSHPVSPETDAGGATMRRVPTGTDARLSRADTNSSANWVYPSEPLTYEEEAGRASHSDERTSSTLSERSQRSTISSNSMTRTMSTRTGNLMAKLAFTNSNQHFSPEVSPVDDNRVYSFTTTNTGRKSPYYAQPSHARTRSMTAGSTSQAPPSAGTDADSFMTARSNFVDLQQEGTALLGGCNPAYPNLSSSNYTLPPLPTSPIGLDRDRDDPYQRALSAHPSMPARQPTIRYADYPSYASGPEGTDYLPHLAVKRPRQGWMGSLRRAIGAMSERSFSLTSNSGTTYTNNAAGMPGTATAASSSSSGMHTAGDRTTTPSPTKRYHSDRLASATTSPRRAMSDGGAAALLRSKRGKDDWEPYRDDPDNDWGHQASGTTTASTTGERRLLRSATHGNSAYASSASQNRPRRFNNNSDNNDNNDDDAAADSDAGAEDEGDDDWDVETAARKRDVQVMFTIPKTRLRVVNADVEAASLRSLSEGGLTRGNSVLSRGSVGSGRSGRRGMGVAREARLNLVDVGEADADALAHEGLAHPKVDAAAEGDVSSGEEFPPRTLTKKGKRKAA